MCEGAGVWCGGQVEREGEAWPECGADRICEDYKVTFERFVAQGYRVR